LKSDVVGDNRSLWKLCEELFIFFLFVAANIANAAADTTTVPVGSPTAAADKPPLLTYLLSSIF
jgi:hypothetical protein